MAIDEDIQESKYGPLISKYVRIAFWEYQRQLYDADCATGIKSALSRLEGDLVNVRLESKEEKHNDSAAPSQNHTLPTHEAHFHQYGRIGVLFLDLYSSRALETGEFNPNTNILNAKQIEFVMKALQIEDLNGILVCMDTNYTGRIISGVEKEKHAVATGLDTWSLNEKVFMQLVQMLYEWNAKKNGRNVQLLSGSNGVGPSGQGLFEDVKTRRVLHQVVVGPMNGPTRSQPVILGVPTSASMRVRPDLRLVDRRGALAVNGWNRSVEIEGIIWYFECLQLTQGQNVPW